MSENTKNNKINKRAMKKGTFSIIACVLVIAIIVVINVLVVKAPVKYTQYDISTGKLYTIGEDTMKVLDELSEDITIYYIVEDGNEDTNIDKLLEQYSGNSKKIKVEKIDPQANPEFTKQYTENEVASNSLIVVGSKRNKVLDYNVLYASEMDYTTYQYKTSGFDGEGQITSALLYVVLENLPVVYKVEGHNEINLSEGLLDRIEKANMEVQSLNLLTADKIPEDAKALLLDSPQSDYSADEAKKVLDYLKNGGKAIILNDYLGKDMPNYESILTEFGIDFADGIVIEQDADHYVQMPYYVVPTIKYSKVTNQMLNGTANVMLNGSRGISVAKELRESLEVTPILEPSEKAFVKTSPEKMKSFEKEDADVDGDFILGALIEENDTQIACFPSSSILDDMTNTAVADGNFTLYLNCLTWMVDVEGSDLVAIPSKSLTPKYLTIARGKGMFYWFIFGLIIPVGILVAGGIYCHRRKKR